MEKRKSNRTTHDMCYTRIYRIWKAMKTRCTNPNSHDFHNYGGRGITVCKEWSDDFMNFYNWAVANGYADDLTIDHIDVNGNYEPNNCRWANNELQAKNRRTSIFITFNDSTHSIPEWEEITGIKSATIRKRLRAGWNIKDVLTKPLKGGE